MGAIIFIPMAIAIIILICSLLNSRDFMYRLADLYGFSPVSILSLGLTKTIINQQLFYFRKETYGKTFTEMSFCICQLPDTYKSGLPRFLHLILHFE